jgi:hypothetical protein
MFIDVENEFSDSQDITATAASTNVVDLMKVRRGAGQPLQIHCSVEVAFDSAANDGTLTIALQSASAAAGSYTTHWSTAALAEATLVAGYQIALPDIVDNVSQYVRLYYTVGGSGNFTAGEIHAAIVLDKQTNGYEHMAATD